MIRRIALLSVIVWGVLSSSPPPGYAQPAIQPHLGYGIHYAPNTSVDTGLIDRLRFDWVKIYETGDAAKFPGRKILYRMDLKWPNDWNRFKADVSDQARNLIGSPITAVEVGNEPNLINEWIEKPNAWQYTQMLRVAYTAIKGVNPDMIVVSAGLAPTITTPDGHAVNDLDFAKEMLENGAGQWFDAFGYHPYGYNEPPEVPPESRELVFRRTERIRRLMEANGVYKQIWLTEFGWLRNPAEDGVSCDDNDPEFRGFAWLRVSGEQQGDYLIRAFEYAHLNWPWAGPTFVWNLNWNMLGGMGRCNHMRWFSLLKSDGSPTTAYYRLQSMRRYTSDYVPKIEIHANRMTASVSMSCLRRVPLGTFKIQNIGYPAPGRFRILPAQTDQPPYVEVSPPTARIGEEVGVYVNPIGVKEPGQYVVHVNIKGEFNGRVISQRLQGYVVVSMSDLNCY
jgi:hypothetical protein